MSTYATQRGDVAGKSYDHEPAREVVLRVSVDLAGGDVGLDIETLSDRSLAEDTYTRTVLTPAGAREYARLLNLAADRAETIHR